MTDLTLDKFSKEVLLIIFSYLSPKCVFQTVSLVCKKFHILTTDETYWRCRLAQGFPYFKYPQHIVSSEKFRYSKACSHVENDYKVWRSQYANCLNVKVLECTAGMTVDTKGKFCVAGSRDRSLCLWDLSKMNATSDSEKPIDHKNDAHKGWIWTIASCDDSNIFTGSFDQHVNEWQLTPTGLAYIQRMKCSTAALCVLAERDKVFASTFDSRILLFDRRCSDSENQMNIKLHIHQRAVLNLVANEKYLFSCSEDKYVRCVDKRTWTVVSSLKLDHYGLSMSLNNDQLWISDSSGNIYMVDARSEHFKVLKSYPILGEKRRVTDIGHNLGSVICLSADRYLHVYANSLQTECFAKIPLPSEPTKMSICDGSVACGYTDGSVGLWLRTDYDLN